MGVETPSHLKSSLMEVVGSDSEGGYVFSERVNSDLSVESRGELSLCLLLFLFVVGSWSCVLCLYGSNHIPPLNPSKYLQNNQLIPPDLARVIRVSSIHDSIPVSTLRDLVSTTPLSTSEGGDWNSQNWVGDALARLVAAGYLDGRDRDRGLDEMVDVVVEAGDEERRFRIE